MKNYIENTDLINAYLDKTLSESEKQAFENKLETDTAFNQLYSEQLAVLEGISRVGLKAEIAAAKQSYVRAKWIKYIGVSVGVILVSALIYSFIFKTETVKVVTPNNNQIETVSEVEIVNKPSEDNIEVLEIPEEIIEKENEIATSQKATRNDVSKEEVVKEETVSEVKVISKPKNHEPITAELKAFFKAHKKAPQIIEVNTEIDFTVTCKEGTILTIPAKSFVDVKTGKLARGKINLEVTEYYKLSDMLLGNLTTKSDDKQLETGGMLYLDANKKGEKLKLKSGRRIKTAFNNKGKTGMQLFLGEESNNKVNWKLDTTRSTIESLFEEEAYDFKLMIKEMMLDSTFIVTDEFEDSIRSYKKQKLIREIGVTSSDEKVIIRKPLLEMENSPFIIHKSDSISRGGHVIRRPLDLHTRLFQAGINARISVKEDKYNVFGVSKLGWINCDRFVSSKKRKIKYKLKIKNADGADVKMVFKSVSSILPSKKYANEFDFGTIPIDEDVKIIAIKEKDGAFFLSIQDTKTKAKPNLEFEFKEVSIQELKKELESLNDSF